MKRIFAILIAVLVFGGIVGAVIYGINVAKQHEQEATEALEQQPPAFKVALRFVLRQEGGYSDHPNDTGGATNHGVTQERYDQWRTKRGERSRSVKQITEHEVRAVYRAIWRNASCPEIVRVAGRGLALAHFDWAVNAGERRALKTLQSCVGTKIDGLWGPKTRAALERCDPVLALRAYLNRREALYKTWSAGGEERVFRKGWLSRLADLRQKIRKEAQS